MANSNHRPIAGDQAEHAQRQLRAEAPMLLGPHEIALYIEDKHRPWWTVWYGRSTRQLGACPLGADPARHALGGHSRCA